MTPPTGGPYIDEWGMTVEKWRERYAQERNEMAFWHRMGVWITKLADFPVSYLNPDYRLVIVPCAYGQRPEAGTEDVYNWTRQAQAAGYSVVGSQWGMPEGAGDCEREAAYAVRMCRSIGFDGWVMNGEKRYEVPNWSKYYVRRFRADLPNMPLGWSPEVRLALDHAYLQANRVCYMPQAYPLEVPVATLDNAVAFGLEFGYELSQMLPLVQAYPTNGRRYPAAVYREEARRLKLPGLVLYAGNQALDVPLYWRDLVL